MKYEYLNDEAVGLIDKTVNTLIKNGVKDADVRNLILTVAVKFSWFIEVNEHSIPDKRDTEKVVLKKVIIKENGLRSLLLSVFELMTFKNYCIKTELNNMLKLFKEECEATFNKRHIKVRMREMVDRTDDGYYLNTISCLLHGISSVNDNNSLNGDYFTEIGTFSVLESLFNIFERDNRDFGDLLRDVHKLAKEEERYY